MPSFTQIRLSYHTILSANTTDSAPAEAADVIEIVDEESTEIVTTVPRKNFIFTIMICYLLCLCFMFLCHGILHCKENYHINTETHSPTLIDYIHKHFLNTNTLLVI